MKQPTKWVYAALTRRKTSCLSKRTLMCLLALTFTACGRSVYHMKSDSDKATENEIGSQAQNIAAPLQSEWIYYGDDLFQMVEDNKLEELKQLLEKPRHYVFKDPCRYVEYNGRLSTYNTHWAGLRKRNCTVIDLAIEKGYSKIFDLFLEHIINLNEEVPPHIDFDTHPGITFSHVLPKMEWRKEVLHTSFLLAIEKGQEEIVKTILKKFTDYIEAPIDYKESLIDEDLLSYYNFNGTPETPLQKAVTTNNSTIIRMVANALKKSLEKSDYDADHMKRIYNKDRNIESMLSQTLINNDLASFKILLELHFINPRGALFKRINVLLEAVANDSDLHCPELYQFDSLIFDYFLKDANVLRDTLDFEKYPWSISNFFLLEKSFREGGKYPSIWRKVCYYEEWDRIIKCIRKYQNKHFARVTGIAKKQLEMFGNEGNKKKVPNIWENIFSYLRTTDVKFNEQTK